MFLKFFRPAIFNIYTFSAFVHKHTAALQWVESPFEARYGRKLGGSRDWQAQAV